MIVGKIYVGLIIVENWRVYKLSQFKMNNFKMVSFKGYCIFVQVKKNVLLEKLFIVVDVENCEEIDGCVSLIFEFYFYIQVEDKEEVSNYGDILSVDIDLNFVIIFV